MGVLTQLIKLMDRWPLLAFGVPGFILVVAGLIAEILDSRDFISQALFIIYLPSAVHLS